MKRGLALALRIFFFALLPWVRVLADCPLGEPGAGGACAREIDNPCTYRYAAARSVHCHCAGAVWDCGTPLGIDVAADAKNCPAAAPKSGSDCTLREKPAYPGMRPGCYYEAPATPVVRDCFCAHFKSSDRRIWHCGQRTEGTPWDTKMCPWVEPAWGSLCKALLKTDCQYGYNLSTTCRCTAAGGISTWQCEKKAQPPSPKR